MLVVDRVWVTRIGVGEVAVAASPAILVDILPSLWLTGIDAACRGPEQRGIILRSDVDVVWIGLFIFVYILGS